MTNLRRSSRLLLIPLFGTLLAVGARAAEERAATTAHAILDASGARGGMVVHLGARDGQLTAALRVSDAFTVHGLALDAAALARARNYLRESGVYGPVSVELHAGSRLPYVDNLINLVVVEQPGDVPEDEIERVLAPGGASCVLRDGKWIAYRKPRPGDIDEWTHFLHDASNNAVANDTRIGPPRSVQWLAPPLWLRSHETPSGIQAPVSSGGRLLYIFDEGLIGITDERLPSRWSLVCRDAFNGKLLWKRRLESWGWRTWSLDRYAGQDWTKLRAARTNVPNDNQRRLVAVGDRVYTTLAYDAPLSILDAATGTTVRSVPETMGTREILVRDGVAVACVRSGVPDAARRRGDKTPVQGRLVGVDTMTQKTLWNHSTGAIPPLSWALGEGRVVFVANRELVALGLRDGQELWRTRLAQGNPRTLVCARGVVVMQGGKSVAAYDATNGKSLWQKKVTPIGGAEADDLFVINGVVWRGVSSVDENQRPARKTPNALVVGWDLRTGKQSHEVFVKNLRSPEHHHRCYRNKATSRFLISSLEGAEFLDLVGDEHSQDNWIRGACRAGMMPCNGMLYVPPDQCFCEPGAKLLGYAALTSGRSRAMETVPDDQRLTKGPAFGKVANQDQSAGDDWPTFRHDAGRHGATVTRVPGDLKIRWRTQLGGRLSAPVSAGGKVYVAAMDAHTIHALDATTGKPVWQFTANGRIDSPPTIYRGLVLFGSADGHVYCLRAGDGQLVWRFLAAVRDQRVAYFDQLESSWPVHGSVLVHGGVAYCTAGRSTYLDGGIRLYGLEPATGRLLHKGLLAGPFPDRDEHRDVSFYLLGANSDVLVSEGGFLFMRQKKMTPDLKEIKADVLSSKGAQDVGLHVFSTSGLLDGSWYNRTFWMYSKRWPGFQLANQAPKTGQLLAVDDSTTYALRVFYRRNVHSPMFFPGRQGYLLFADDNSNEPQIVGEPGSRPPLKWLPQSDYSRGRGDQTRTLESEAFGLDKMIGYTRAEPPTWTCWLPVRVRSMVKTADKLFVAGPPDVLDPQDPTAAFDGRRGARLVAVSSADGKKLADMPLPGPPVFDGLIAARGQLYAALRDGSITCLAGKSQRN